METNDTLEIRSYEHNGVPVVEARGDVDLSTAPKLRAALETACADGLPEKAGTLGLDIREVPFIDSAGLALLVEIRKRFYDRCRLALVIARGSQPERVLKLGRFDTFLAMHYAPEEVSGAAPEMTARPVAG